MSVIEAVIKRYMKASVPKTALESVIFSQSNLNNSAKSLLVFKGREQTRSWPIVEALNASKSLYNMKKDEFTLTKAVQYLDSIHSTIIHVQSNFEENVLIKRSTTINKDFGLSRRANIIEHEYGLVKTKLNVDSLNKYLERSFEELIIESPELVKSESNKAFIEECYVKAISFFKDLSRKIRKSIKIARGIRLSKSKSKNFIYSFSTHFSAFFEYLDLKFCHKEVTEFVNANSPNLGLVAQATTQNFNHEIYNKLN